MKPKKTYKEIPIGGLILEAGNAKEFKTGEWRSSRPVRDEKKCINCMLCYIHCPDSSITGKNGNFGEFLMDYCKGCGVCASICPVKCIQMEEESKYQK